MIYLNYKGVVAATAVGPMGPGRTADAIVPGPDPAQALWAGDVDDVAYYLAYLRSRLAMDEDHVPVADAGPKA